MNYNRMIKTDEDMEAAFVGMKAAVKYKRKEFQSLSASEISYEYGALLRNAGEIEQKILNARHHNMRML